jgi:hypothetical protein
VPSTFLSCLRAITCTVPPPFFPPLAIPHFPFSSCAFSAVAREWGCCVLAAVVTSSFGLGIAFRFFRLRESSALER